MNNTNNNSSKNNESEPDLGVAIPLITIVNKKFILNKEAIEILAKDENKTIGIISLVGKYRTGKSFLLNRVLLNNNLTSKSFGFTVGPTIKPCTKGIWMWSKPIAIKNNHHDKEFNVYFIDTEGLGAYDEEINHDSKVFLIAILLSSLFLLNTFSSIDENAVNNLSLILNLTQTIKLNKDEDKPNPEELSKFFPSLLWLIRDFALKLEDSDGNTITAKQYLENALALVKGQSTLAEGKNKVRKMIKLYFQERDCFTMVRPVESEEQLQNLNTLEDRYFRPEFLSQSETLRNKVFKKVKPKIFNGKLMTGKMVISMLSSILESLNQGAIPVIESAWSYVISTEGIKYFESMSKEYSEQLKDYFEKLRVMDSSEMLKNDFSNDLNKFNKSVQLKLINDFEQIIRGIDENDSTNMIDKFKIKLETIFSEVNETNQKIFKEKFTEILASQFKAIEEKISNKDYFSKDTTKIPDFMKISNNNSNNNNNNDPYSSILSPTINYHQFFQDIDDIKDLIENSTPDFKNKKEDLQVKLISIIKFFIEESFIKEKSIKDLELIRIINEKLSIERKQSTLNEDINEIKNEFKAEKERFGTETLELKSELRGKNETISIMEKEKRRLIEEKEQLLQQNNKDNNELISKLEKKIYLLESESKENTNTILTMKFNEEKIQALSQQKSEFLEKEIDSLKEKVKFLSKLNEEQKTNIDNLNTIIDEQKNEISDLKQSVSNSNNNDADNDDVIREKQAQIESLKMQVDETKKIYEEVIENLKFNLNKKEEMNDEKDNNGAVNKENNSLDYKEIVESNKNLSLALANYEARCLKLEDKIENYKQIKGIILSGAGIQCKTCNKIFSYEIYKSHYQECKIDLVTQNKNTNNQDPFNNNENFRIKILKGIICQDEQLKPYIEYIIEVSFNLQLWRLNKKFNQFVNLHRALSKTFPTLLFPESSSIFFVSEISNNFHENKIKKLEKYLKDLSLIDCVVNSNLFRMFIGFDSHFDNSTMNASNDNNNLGYGGSLGYDNESMGSGNIGSVNTGNYLNRNNSIGSGYNYGNSINNNNINNSKNLNNNMNNSNFGDVNRIKSNESNYFNNNNNNESNINRINSFNIEEVNNNNDIPDPLLSDKSKKNISNKNILKYKNFDQLDNNEVNHTDNLVSRLENKKDKVNMSNKNNNSNRNYKKPGFSNTTKISNANNNIKNSIINSNNDNYNYNNNASNKQQSKGKSEYNAILNSINIGNYNNSTSNNNNNYVSTVKTNDPNVIIDKLNVKKKPINKMKMNK